MQVYILPPVGYMLYLFFFHNFVNFKICQICLQEKHSFQIIFLLPYTHLYNLHITLFFLFLFCANFLMSVTKNK